MGRCCLTIRRAARGAAAGMCLLLLVIVAVPELCAAQIAGLDQPANWEYREVYWRDAGNLPVDNEFAAPLVAQYNWAYGMTVVGINVKGVGSESYYAAIALYNSGYLDAMDVIGPLTQPAMWDAGPFHIAAGLADGRIIVWLTAPGEMPHQVVFTDAYLPESAFDVTVYTPAQANTKWGEWDIVGAFQRTAGDYTLSVEDLYGDGTLKADYGDIGMPGNVSAVSYMDYLAAGALVPVVLMTVVRDDQQVPGNNEHLLTQGAYFDKDNSWYVYTLRNSGIDNGAVFCGYSDQAQMLVAYDESDQYDVNGALQQVTFTNPNDPSAGWTLGSFDNVPVAATYDTWAYFNSARTSLPMVVASDGGDVYLGFYAPSAGRIGSELGYDFALLHQGEARQDANGLTPQYPVIGVAAASHWSTGDPELFWVQRGSINHAGGQLYHLQYVTPPQG